MLEALLHGKLSHEQENMEDILTSNVFGSLQYLPPDQGLLPFVGRAVTASGEHPLDGLPADTQASYSFWPWMEETGCSGCEPDLLLDLTLPVDKPILAIVEAKYLSGKSSEADETASKPQDQLAREWDNLVCRAGDTFRPILIYLTADLRFPASDINDAISEYTQKRGTSPTICWLSWRHLASVVCDSDSQIARALCQMLRRLDLIFYSGTHPIKDLRPILWSFQRSPCVFHRRLCVPPITWSFRS